MDVYPAVVGGMDSDTRSISTSQSTGYGASNDSGAFRSSRNKHQQNYKTKVECDRSSIIYINSSEEDEYSTSMTEISMKSIINMF